jgi:hypothetical protein
MHLKALTRETRIALLRIDFFLAWKLYEQRIQGIDKSPENLAEEGK